MVIWCVVWGAVLGLLWPGSGGTDFIAGGILGSLAGVSLRWAIREEVEAAWRKVIAAAVPEPAPPVHSERMQVPTPPIRQDSAQAFDAAHDDDSVNRIPVPNPSIAPPFPQASIQREASSTEEREPNYVSPSVPVASPVIKQQPNAVDQVLLAAKAWLLGGNTIVRVGLVILFIGLSFLARYAASAGFFPVEFRLGAIGAAAIALMAIGFRKRIDRPGFALALQGAGVAVMYLTIFAAFRLYALMPSIAAFALMITVCGLSCALALLQNSRTLAVAAFTGGFAVPVLLSTGQGSHVGLFSYYTVLNLAILYIAHRRSWRILNAVGFIATFGISTLWGILKYAPEHYESTQPFLIGFLLIYIATAILYARNTPTRLGNAVDSMLVFGTPLIAFGLQAGLVHGRQMGVAFSALGFAALYLLAALLLARRASGSYRLLIESFLALGVGFATLTVPLALDARWTSGVWAIEGAGAFWVGIRQARWMSRAFGLLLQVVAALIFISTIGANVANWPLANPAFLGALLIALPGFAIAWWLRQSLPHSNSVWAKEYAEFESQLSSPTYLYGFLFWCVALCLEITRNLPAHEHGQLPVQVFAHGTAQLLIMLALVGSAALSMRAGLQFRWVIATWPARLTLPVMSIAFFFQVANGHRVLQTPAWAIWPLVLLAHYWALRKFDQLDVENTNGRASKANRGFHAASVWLIALLFADCLWLGIDKASLWHTSWAGVVILISAILILTLLGLWAGRFNQPASRPADFWPLRPHADAYYWIAAAPLGGLIFFGTLFAAIHSSGQTNPLPYIPLLNPTDLTLALALSALLLWRRILKNADPNIPTAAPLTGNGAITAWALLAFIVINSVWLRVAHHFFGVDWSGPSLFASFVVQTGYAILWSLLALALMIVAHRKMHRKLWLIGAGVLGLVVIKLFLIDLSNAGGAERIIAFIVVGVLMLVVGYLAPLPPRPPAVTEAGGAYPQGSPS